jgi:hypothetical protein
MKQTAVDWLESKIIQMVNHGSDFGEDFPALAVHLNKAKEMEKQQMIDAWSNGWLNDYQSDEDVKNSAEHYYNETFNKKEK